MEYKKSRRMVWGSVIIAFVFALIAFFGHPFVGILSLLSLCAALSYEVEIPDEGTSFLEVVAMAILLVVLLAMLGVSMLSTGTVYGSSDRYVVVHSAVEQHVFFTNGKMYTTTYYYTVSPWLYERTFNVYVPKYVIERRAPVKMNGSVVGAMWFPNLILFSATTKMSNIAFDGVTFTPVGHGNVLYFCEVVIAVVVLAVSFVGFILGLNTLQDLLLLAVLYGMIIVMLGIVINLFY